MVWQTQLASLANSTRFVLLWQAVSGLEKDVQEQSSEESQNANSAVEDGENRFSCAPSAYRAADADRFVFRSRTIRRRRTDTSESVQNII